MLRDIISATSSQLQINRDSVPIPTRLFQRASFNTCRGNLHNKNVLALPLQRSHSLTVSRQPLRR